MVCSHYELEAQDKDGNILTKMWVYSFEEAYYWIDEIRERHSATAVKFILKYPDIDVYGAESTHVKHPERKKAKWLLMENPNYSPFDLSPEKIAVCPVCGYSRGQDYFNYCPNCGADMKGDETK